MSKFVKVMFGTSSGAKRDFKYKIGNVNISNNWNPNAESGKDFGGFNYCNEECILRWLHRGDTIYDVEVPKDAENIKIEGATTIYRTNKIIILRTSVNKCYKRVIDRWKKINENYTEDDLIKYQNKKLGMYKWYKSLNEFIKNIDSF